MRIHIRDNTADLSVVIPCLHEAANLRVLLPKLRACLDGLGISWEILVVDGASGDGSEGVAEAEGARYVCETAPGYGAAIMRGAMEAHGEFILTMDADLSHPTHCIQDLWNAREGADIVIASRYVPGGQADQPWVRYQLSRVLNNFFRRGLSLEARDLSSGFRLYRKCVFANAELTFSNFVILLEILLVAYGAGRRVKEIPFHYQPRIEGTSHARILRFGIDYLRLFRRVWAIRNSIEFPDYDWRAYDSRIWLQRYWQRTRHKIVLRFVPRGATVCDVGCGSSRILGDLPGAVGVDLRFTKLLFMRRTGNPLLQADGMRLPFADGAFDCVLCSQVIEHIPEENGHLIDELTRILRPGGTLILGTPDYDRVEWLVLEWLYGKLAPGAYADEHVTHYTYATLSKALTDRGYALDTHAYVGRGELIIKATRK